MIGMHSSYEYLIKKNNEKYNQLKSHFIKQIMMRILPLVI